MKPIDLSQSELHLRRNLRPRTVANVTKIQDAPCFFVLHLLYCFVNLGAKINEPINLSVNLFFTLDEANCKFNCRKFSLNF